MKVSKVTDVVSRSANGAQICVAVTGFMGYVVDDNDTCLTLWVENAEIV